LSRYPGCKRDPQKSRNPQTISPWAQL
jgi:hypothetical protein